jgi:hypothetical protein
LFREIQLQRLPFAAAKVELEAAIDNPSDLVVSALPPEQPHNAQSLYYQTIFNGMIGRPPTWADAMAHCDASTRRAWETHLREIGAWSEPPDGEAPVKHHGV